MSNLTYNPNVNIPYHSKYNMDDDDSYGRNYDIPPMLQQIDPRADPRGDLRGEPRMESFEGPRMSSRNEMRGAGRKEYYEEPETYSYNPRIENEQFYRKPSKQYKPKKKSNYYEDYKSIDKFEEPKENKHNKFNWLSFGKKIIIFTALFLLMSSVKMDDLVCKFIPFLSNNQLLCMTIKGILLSLIIILIQLLL